MTPEAQAQPPSTSESTKPFEFDPLVAFAAWYTAQPGFGLPLCPHFGVTRIGRQSGLVLFRQGQFQVQLWVCDPMSEVPDHGHPHIDAIHVYLAGDIFFRINRKPAVTENDIATLPDGRCAMNRANFRSRPGEVHGATIGSNGGAFLAIQHWLKGSPTSEVEDWDGDPIDEAHAARLREMAA